MSNEQEVNVNPFPLYTPAEMVRLELLRYNDPEGIHPVELAWRQLARKLFNHVEAMQNCLEEHNHPTKWSGDMLLKGECSNHIYCAALRAHKFPPKFSIKK